MYECERRLTTIEKQRELVAFPGIDGLLVEEQLGLQLDGAVVGALESAWLCVG